MLGLLLLFVDHVGLCNRVVLLSLVFLRRILLVLIVEGGVVGMAFADAIFVALGNQLYESFL